MGDFFGQALLCMNAEVDGRSVKNTETTNDVAFMFAWRDFEIYLPDGDGTLERKRL